MLDFANWHRGAWSLCSRRRKGHQTCNRAGIAWINCNSDPWRNFWWWGSDGSGGKSVKEWTSLLIMLHLPQRNLHTRESQVALLCDDYYRITLKWEISLVLGLRYVILDQENKAHFMDLWMFTLNIPAPKNTTCECLNTLKITVTFLLFVWPAQEWLYFIVYFKL